MRTVLWKRRIRRQRIGLPPARFLFSRELVNEPCPGEPPVTLCGVHRNTQGHCRFLNTQASEVPQFGQSCSSGVLLTRYRKRVGVSG
jgi:hypothetical protein